MEGDDEVLSDDENLIGLDDLVNLVAQNTKVIDISGVGGDINDEQLSFKFHDGMDNCDGNQDVLLYQFGESSIGKPLNQDALDDLFSNPDDRPPEEVEDNNISDELQNWNNSADLSHHDEVDGHAMNGNPSNQDGLDGLFSNPDDPPPEEVDDDNSSEELENRNNSADPSHHDEVDDHTTNGENSSLSSNSLKSLRKRKAPFPEPKFWKKNGEKEKRRKGEEYVGYHRINKEKSTSTHNALRNARTMGAPCTSSKCTKSLRQCSFITHEVRFKLFKKMWILDWGEKKMFVASMVRASEPQRRRTSKKESSQRQISYKYFLKDGPTHFLVCQNMFLSTLGLKKSTIRYWLSEYYVNEKPADKEVASGIDTSSSAQLSADTSEIATFRNTPNKSIQRARHMRNFLNEIPKLPSHYCRANSERLYLQTDIVSLKQLYRLYCDKAKNSSMVPVSWCLFHRETKIQKLTVYQPRKDLCDTCCKFKLRNLSQADYDEHIVRKDRAQLEKKNDKLRAAKGEIHLFACDMMAVRMLPSINASIAYYKMKLAIHNFTVFNLKTHDAMNYWFTETEANLVASTFATCLVKSVEEALDEGVREVVIFSDGCTYQNRNVVLANALLDVAVRRQVTIQQKYLEKGHTYMEVDSVHSTIEGEMKNKDIFLPSQFLQVTREARKNEYGKYRAKLLDYSFFKNYCDSSVSRYDSIRPGSKSGDPMVTDIRCLEYDPSGIIRFKLEYDDEYQQLPRRPKKSLPQGEIPKLYQQPIAIPKDKYLDLKSMKDLIPKDCYHFYESLPHQENSYRKTKKLIKIGDLKM